LSEDLKYIGFPAGVNKKCLDGVSYELDNDTDTLTITYAGEIYDFFLKSKAPYLIERYGEKKIQNAQRVSGVLFPLSFLLFVFSLWFGWIMGEFFTKYCLHLMVTFVSGIFIFAFLEGQLCKVNELCRNTRCNNCGRDFAYEESQKPLIKEVSTQDRYEITRTRYWKCKYCANEDLREETLDYNQSKGKRNYWQERTCKRCKNRYSMVEYRIPDVKEINSIKTTIRHYKCSHCSYREITMEKETLEPDYE